VAGFIGWATTELGDINSAKDRKRFTKKCNILRNKKLNNMRDYILLFVNDKKYKITGERVFQPLADYLRTDLNLVGTKIVCSEGDCGACTVISGRVNGKSLKYDIINSCISYVYQMDCCHIITVEGLKANGNLNPVQTELAENHGTQCGFCTPGFSVAMTNITSGKKSWNKKDIVDGLIGNLCRCTGYQSIIKSGMNLKQGSLKELSELYPSKTIIKEFNALKGNPVNLEASIDNENYRFFHPEDLKSALEFKSKNPDAQIIAGGTDLGVLSNKGIINPKNIMSLSSVSDLDGIEQTKSHIVIGANTTWTSVENFTKEHLPEFYKIVKLLGSPQIKNIATIGGNIINASPIADSLPFLFITDAELELQNSGGTRKVKISEFYKSYKKMDILPDELLTKVIIPVPGKDYKLKLYKVSKRKDLDIASFTAGIMMKLGGKNINDVRLSYGGVGPIVYRLYNTEKYLKGKTFNLETLKEAGNIAVDEISPISDVRGSKKFRNLLAKNILFKYFYDYKK